VKIIGGDLNAQMGRESNYIPSIRKESLHIASNDNGIRVINFAVSKHLVVSSTFFPKKNIHKQTWVFPNTINKSQINYIIIEKRHKSCIINLSSYKEADGDTDHYFLVIGFSEKLSVIWEKKTTEKEFKMFNWIKATGLK
jgi:hypothetical protein